MTELATPPQTPPHDGTSGCRTPSAPIPASGEGIKAIIDLTNKAAEVRTVSFETEGLGEGLPASIPLVIDQRPGGGISGLKRVVEEYRIRPERRTGTAKVSTLQSFIDLANRHKDAHSVIFAQSQWPSPKLTTVVDYHEKDGGAPRHLKHQIVYDFPVTDEFKVWIAGNAKQLEQAEFASFLEDHAAELASPFDGERVTYEVLFKERIATPSELISLSRSLEVFVGAKVKRAERLQTGERTVEFVEEHTNAKGEKVDIPGIFIVSVPAFMDGEPVRIPARLRYRISGGSIVWFYQLYRWENALRDRVKQDLETAAQETELPAFEGAPEA